MFRRRLWWFTIGLAGLAIVIAVRLVELQVAHAGQYEALAARLTLRPIRYLRPPRGRILDRSGRELLSDQPSADITVHYGVLAGDADYVRRVARQLRRQGSLAASLSTDEAAAQVYHEIDNLRQRLATLTGRPLAELVERSRQIQERVQRIKRIVQARTPTINAIQEENMWHPLLEDVDEEVALAVRLEMGRFPWIRVQPGSTRVAQNADSMAHLLGRLGAASEQHLDQDPLKDDELHRLMPQDQVGISGVERLCELTLRGTRGKVVEDFDRDVIERLEPRAGENVVLTIELDLQEQILGLLEKAVSACPHPSGAAAVVIDVETREILALVSYPTYRYDEYRARYSELVRDKQRMPTMPRAFRAIYPPGSTCKAIAACGALSDGVVSAGTRFHCRGALDPVRQPNAFRCWIYNTYRTTHDATHEPRGQRAEDAIRNSCNIYFYKVGGLLGPERLCHWFDRFGLGRDQGSGLNESNGINPTPEWMAQRSRRYQGGSAWNFAIGQGEVSATPLQVANVSATIASGVWRPVRLARTTDGHWLSDDITPGTPLSDGALRPIRTGMWRVVNERGGTAHGHATLSKDAGPWVLCGKTGSAQSSARVIRKRYVCEWPDGRREDVIAGSAREALATFEEPRPRIIKDYIVELFPSLHEGERRPAHAWFMGYTQSRSTKPGTRPSGRSYAISVLIEYGDSGGRVAGPVARQIAELLVKRDPQESTDRIFGSTAGLHVIRQPHD